MKNLHLGAIALLVVAGCGGGGGSSTAVKSGTPSTGDTPGQDVAITPGMTGGSTSGSTSGSTGESTPPPVETIKPLVGKYAGSASSRTFVGNDFTSPSSAQVLASMTVDETGAFKVVCGDRNGSAPVLEAVGTLIDGQYGTTGTWQSLDPKTGVVTPISSVAVGFVPGPDDQKRVVLTVYSDEAKTQGQQWAVYLARSGA